MVNCTHCKKTPARCVCAKSSEKTSREVDPDKIDELFGILMPKLELKLTQLLTESLEKAVEAATAHLTQEITQLREDNATLSKRIADLEKAPPGKPYGAPPENLFKAPDFLSAVSRAMDEQAEREKKKLNLVIVGLPEPQPGLSHSPTPTDFDTVAQLAAQLSIPSGKIERVFRHGREVQGKARITKLVFSCPDARYRFLSGLRPLLVGQEASPSARPPYYVRPDLTRSELDAQADLNRQRIDLIKAGKDAVIFRGKVMERAERDRLRSEPRTPPQVQSNNLLNSR